MTGEKQEKDKFRAELSRRADKYFNKCTSKKKKQLNKHIQKIENNPYSGYPLHGDLSGLWAIHSGEFRIIYKINAESKTVEIVHIGPRGDIYKKV